MNIYNNEQIKLKKLTVFVFEISIHNNIMNIKYRIIMRIYKTSVSIV